MGFLQSFITILPSQEHIQATGRIADRMGYGNDIASLGAAAQQGFPGFDFAKGGHGDDDAFFRHDRIAAEDIDLIGPADILDAAIHFNDVVDFHLRRQRRR